ncbi:MAG: hypothetical protein LQ342_001672 [Letrouitia transgressa]|nr:MAG: hypothetical protein LQ342_001672 [Letrouitia transgressa]
MSSRKRGRAEMEAPESSPEPDLLHRIRNAWEFANLMQYIFFFGRAVKIDEDLTIEDLEIECVKPEPSEKLAEIGLALLKYISWHRGLTPELFDEFTRRQYVSKAPDRNPFGIEETPKKFADFNVFTKLRVLVQLSQWTLINADRMREKMAETKDTEQTQWRIEEIGYDREERLYFVLDDNRLYRRTDPPPPPPPPRKPKANSKKCKTAARASKRRKSEATDDMASKDGDPEDDSGGTKNDKDSTNNDGLDGRIWECLAANLDEYNMFLSTIQKSRDPNEKLLYQRIAEEVLPVIQREEESRTRKKARQDRELMTIQKLATAKRSSRLASKFEREREEQETAEAERKRKADIAAALQEQERRKKMEEARESRMMTREQRLKEREYKRILQEEELANLSEDSKKLNSGEARISERHLKTEMEKRRKELAALTEEDVWNFDCSECGVHGENLDDGTHSVACEKCNVWQHSACLGISQAAAERDDFHFICRDCQRRAEDAAKPKIPPLRFHFGSSSSPPSRKRGSENDGLQNNSAVGGNKQPPLKKFKPAEVRLPPAVSGQAQTEPNGLSKVLMNGPTLSPEGQIHNPARSGQQISQVLPTPGLRSLPRPPSSPKRYTQHINHPESSRPSLESYLDQAAPSVPSDIPTTTSARPSHSWSERHASVYTPQGGPHESNPSRSPYYNSLNRQNFPYSHSNHDVWYPAKARLAAHSPQNSYDKSTTKLSPYTNGISNHPDLPAAQPPPVKHQTSPPPPTIAPLGSSPINHPTLQKNTPSSPGFSPTKQSPPRPLPSQQMAAPPVLPPVTTLMPSPEQIQYYGPIKGATPERQTTVNYNNHQ